jgi:hypothetical protein
MNAEWQIHLVFLCLLLLFGYTDAMAVNKGGFVKFSDNWSCDIAAWPMNSRLKGVFYVRIKKSYRH